MGEPVGFPFSRKYAKHLNWFCVTYTQRLAFALVLVFRCLARLSEKELVYLAPVTKSPTEEGGENYISWNRRGRRSLMIAHHLPQLELVGNTVTF